MRHRILFCIILMVIVGIGLQGCTIKTSSNGGKSKNERKKKGPGFGKEDDENRAVPVEATTVQDGRISAFLLLSSTVTTELAVEVYSELTDFVTNVNVEEGDYVRKGDVLIQLDKEDYELLEAKARLAYENKQKDYNLLKDLHERKFRSNQEFSEAEFLFKQAELDWREAKLNLERTEIKAPISGIISQRNVNVGERVTTTQSLLSIVNLNEMIVHVNVPETDMSRCHVGQEVVVTSDFLGDESVQGWVKRISPVVDAASGTFKVTVGIKDGAKKLKPGSFINVHIITHRKENAILIPKDAVIYESDRQFAFTVENDTLAIKNELELGLQDAEKFEVLAGVAVGDTIIMIGQSGLKNRSTVDIVKWQDVTFREGL